MQKFIQAFTIGIAMFAAISTCFAEDHCVEEAVEDDGDACYHPPKECANKQEAPPAKVKQKTVRENEFYRIFAKAILYENEMKE